MKKGHDQSPDLADRSKRSGFANSIILPIFSAISIVILHIIFVSAPTPGHDREAAETNRNKQTLKALNSFALSDSQLAQYSHPSVFLDSDRKVRLTATQEDILINAINDIDHGKWADAHGKITSLNSAFARRLFNWLWLTKYDDDAPFDNATLFLNAVPNWPDQFAIRRKIERSLEGQHFDSPFTLTSWFDKKPPLTPEGMRHYIHNLDQAGESDKARKTLAAYWETTLLKPNDQKYFYKHFGEKLTEKNHARRIDTLLHARQYTNARNLARVMPGDYRKLVDARIALAENKSGVDWYIRQVPQNLQNDPGLLYERLKWRRERNLHLRAVDILNFPPEKEDISNPRDWWLERHIMARRMIDISEFKTAYTLATNHRQTEGFAYAQAEWLSGWLAISFLDKPAFAYTHFQNLYNHVETPISRSRGAYWSGKAKQELGQLGEAAHWYKIASRHGGTFYGQLAASTLEKLRPQLTDNIINASLSGRDITEQVSFAINFPKPPITFEAQRAFDQHEMVQAARLLYKAGLTEDAGAFLDALSRKAKHPVDFRLVADFAMKLGQAHKALNAAKDASYSGIVLTDHQFPVVYDVTKGVNEVELALVHGIMRQESAFNTKAQSHAGARGLMQLMPATAMALSRKYKIRHSTKWLTEKPEHNVKLGAIYLRDLLKRYDNSYVLAIAAYNAGPGRVNRWLKEYGDPRKTDISWIDWIELIPIYETRNYVQRVLEAVYVYRYIFNDTPNTYPEEQEAFLKKTDY